MYCKYFAYDGKEFDTLDDCQNYEKCNIPNQLTHLNALENSLTSKSIYDLRNCKSKFDRVEKCKKLFVKELYHKENSWLKRTLEMYKISKDLLEAINDYNDTLRKLHNIRSNFNYLKSLEDK